MFTGIKYIDYSILITTVLLVSFVMLRVLRFFLSRFLNHSSAQLQVDPTRYHFLKNALSFLIFLLAVVIILFSVPELKQLGLTLFAGAGILAAIVGFASQAAFSNIVSGIFIVIFRPFRVGDIVKISNQYFGTVEDITLRHTVIRDIENKRFIIPNSVISSEVIHNYLIDDEKVSNQIYFGISYSADIDKAFKIIREEALKHPNIIDNRSEEDIKEGRAKVMVRVVEWLDSSIQLRATVWSENPSKGFELKCDLLKSVKYRFDEEGIEIPFPHRVVVMKREEDE